MNGLRALGARFAVDPTAARALTLSLAAVLCACSGKVDDAGQTTVLPAISSGLVNSMPNMSAARLDQGDGREATVLYFSR